MKGYTIDGKYLYPVLMYMKIESLPRPRLRKPTPKHLLDDDGNIMPIIRISVR